MQLINLLIADDQRCCTMLCAEGTGDWGRFVALHRGDVVEELGQAVARVTLRLPGHVEMRALVPLEQARDAVVRTFQLACPACGAGLRLERR